jgi:capsular exopolysaccharide synthesis family protein
MSRFYDALKEASRIRPTADGEGEREPLGSEVPILNVAAEEELELGAARAEQQVLGPKLESLHEVLVQLAAIPTAGAAPTNGILPAEAGKPGEGEALPTFGSEVPVQNDAAVRELEPSDVRHVGLPAGMLGQGTVPPKGTLHAKTEIAFDPRARLIPHATDSAVVEHYRRLRTKILQQHATKPFQSLIVTSPGPQEGKTVTVLNLGLSFAMLPNFKVLVIDGDLRRGSIGKWLGVDDHPGLSNLLEGTVELEDVVLKGADIPLHVVTRGNSKMSPAELLHSPKMGVYFRRMTEHFDLVLVDSPPVTLITDAQLLAGGCDAVLLIARAFSTTRRALEQATQELSPFRVIGTVLNGGTRAQLYRRYNGYYG